MSRIRSIKPEWLDDERMVLSSDAARTLSVALIVLADDYGNGRAGRLWLAARVFPGRPIEVTDQALQELVTMRYVLLYEVNGQTYFAIRNWDKHQRVDRPGSPKVPGPNLAVTTGNHDDSSGDTKSQENHASPQELPGIPRTTHASPSHPSSGSDLSFLTSPTDQPGKPGSARARRKPSAKVEYVPAPMHDGWEPSREIVGVLAVQYSVTEERVSATTPEFRLFWKRRGDRKKPQGWERAFAANVERLAKSGALYAAPVVGTQRRGPNDPAALQARAAALVALQTKAIGES